MMGTGDIVPIIRASILTLDNYLVLDSLQKLRSAYNSLLLSGVKF